MAAFPGADAGEYDPRDEHESELAIEQFGLDLHVAVWNNDLDTLAMLISEGSIDLETRDPQGATPLLLAYKLGRHKAAAILLQAGAYAKPRVRNRWEAQHFAACTRNVPMLRTATLSILKETDLAWERRVPRLTAALREMPDFDMTMEWTFKSWVPLVSTMLPSDSVRIRKRGTALRFDMTLLGMNGLSWERGNTQLIMQGEEHGNPGAVILMDSELKTAGNGRTPLTLAPDTSVQDIVRKSLTQEQSDTDVWSRDCEMKPVMKSSWVVFNSSEQASATIGDWGLCKHFKLSGMKLTSLKHSAILPVLPLDSWWKEEYALETREHKVPEKEKQPGIHNWEAVGPKFRSQAASASDPGSGSGSGSLGSSKETVGSSTPSSADEKAKETKYAPAASGGGSGGSDPEEPPPEAGLAPLKSMIQKLESGGFSGSSSVDWEAALSGDEDGVAASALESIAVRERSFYSYFEGKTMGSVDPEDIRNSNRGSRGILAHHHEPSATGDGTRAGTGTDTDTKSGEDADALTRKKPPIAPKPGHEKLPVADMYPENVRTEEKTIDADVFFCEDFPITKDQMVSVAGVMARTASHFKNVQRFFENKMPAKAGFPVRFQLPVFYTINATVTFSKCKLVTPDASLFEVPADFKWGAYKERGMIRQL